jgi:hypothetical protein
MGAAWLWAQSDIRRRWRSLVVVGLRRPRRRLRAGVGRWGPAPSAPSTVSSTSPIPRSSSHSWRTSRPRSWWTRSSTTLGSRIERSNARRIAPALIVPGESGVMAVSAESSTGGFGRPRLVSADTPDAGAADEILVNERSASTYDLRTGQRVTLRSIACYVGRSAGVDRRSDDRRRRPAAHRPDCRSVNQGTASVARRSSTDSGGPAPCRLHTLFTSTIAATPPPSWPTSRCASTTATSPTTCRARGGRAPRRCNATPCTAAAALAGVAGLLVVAQALARHLGGSQRRLGGARRHGAHSA